MKQFKGFPARMEFTPLPNLFFNILLPQIDNMAELKTTLYALASLYRKRGYPHFVTYRELLASTSLMNSLGGTTQPPDEILRDALKNATGRGVFLHVSLEKEEVVEDIYLLST